MAKVRRLTVPPRSGAGRAVRRGLLAAGVAAVLLLGPSAGRAASVLPATDAALVPWADTAGEGPAPGGAPASPSVPPGLDPAVLRHEIDLLLELQVDGGDLGDTPADGPPAGGLGAAVDLDVLSPGLPANPRFPGYGLSFALPTGPSRVGLEEAHPAASGQAPRRWGAGGGLFGFDAGGRLAEPIGELRAWVAEHRTMLLIALGLAALAVAAAAALMRPVPDARPRRSRRRRSRSRGSDPADHRR